MGGIQYTTNESISACQMEQSSFSSLPCCSGGSPNSPGRIWGRYRGREGESSIELGGVLVLASMNGVVESGPRCFLPYSLH